MVQHNFVKLQLKMPIVKIVLRLPLINPASGCVQDPLSCLLFALTVQDNSAHRGCPTATVPCVSVRQLLLGPLPSSSGQQNNSLLLLHSNACHLKWLHLLVRRGSKDLECTQLERENIALFQLRANWVALY